MIKKNTLVYTDREPISLMGEKRYGIVVEVIDSRRARVLWSGGGGITCVPINILIPESGRDHGRN